MSLYGRLSTLEACSNASFGGGRKTVNGEEGVTVRLPLLIVIGAVTAPSGTWTLSWLGDTMLKGAAKSPTFTPLTVLRPLPVIVKVEPRGPAGGANEATPSLTVNVPGDWAVPAACVAATWPATASGGTVNLNEVGPVWVSTPTSAPPSVAEVTESRFAPLTVTTVPAGP